MNISNTANLLKNQASTSMKENLLAQAEKTNRKSTSTEETDTTNTSSTTDAVAGAETVGESFDTFLMLLTAQIKNQDPLAPLDSTQFVEQLATFSGLELQAKGNVSLSRIEVLLEQQGLLTQPEASQTEATTDTKS